MYKGFYLSHIKLQPKLIAISLAILCYSGNIIAAGSIYGQIRNKITGKPVPYASIAVENCNAIEALNDGAFIIDCPTGSYSLKISAENYKTYTFDSFYLNDNEFIKKDVLLTPLQTTTPKRNYTNAPKNQNNQEDEEQYQDSSNYQDNNEEQYQDNSDYQENEEQYQDDNYQQENSQDQYDNYSDSQPVEKIEKSKSATLLGKLMAKVAGDRLENRMQKRKQRKQLPTQESYYSDDDNYYTDDSNTESDYYEEDLGENNEEGNYPSDNSNTDNYYAGDTDNNDDYIEENSNSNYESNYTSDNSNSGNSKINNYYTDDNNENEDYTEKYYEDNSDINNEDNYTSDNNDNYTATKNITTNRQQKPVTTGNKIKSPHPLPPRLKKQARLKPARKNVYIKNKKTALIKTPLRPSKQNSIVIENKNKVYLFSSGKPAKLTLKGRGLHLIKSIYAINKKGKIDKNITIKYNKKSSKNKKIIYLNALRKARTGAGFYRLQIDTGQRKIIIQPDQINIIVKKSQKRGINSTPTFKKNNHPVLRK